MIRNLDQVFLLHLFLLINSKPATPFVIRESREQFEAQDAKSQRSSGGGDPKVFRGAPQGSTQSHYDSAKSNVSQVSRNVSVKNSRRYFGTCC